MAKEGFSRRYFFYGSLLAGAIPAGGFGQVPSLRRMGYKSPNEKLNIAAIGAGGQPFSDLRQAYGSGNENVVALADVDWERGAAGFDTFPQAAKYNDFRQMLDRSGNDIDAVICGTPDHNHAYCALTCMQAGKHVYCEKPLTRTSAEARMLALAAEKYDVATQMGNQGYSHDATRVACEIIWSGEIGDVTEVHAWTGRASWPQEMTRIPPPTPVPDSLNWDAWLGTAEWREFTEGDQDYWDFVLARSGGGGGFGGTREDGRPQYGFYLPFNWRGFYDFGSGLIGDWGVHILGPANWALQLDPSYLISVECIHKNMLPDFTFPDELTIRYDFAARPGMPPVSVYWYHHPNGDAYLPPGMTAEEARKIPDTGPQVGPAQGRGGFFAGSGGGAPAARGQAPAGRGAPEAGARGQQPAGRGQQQAARGRGGADRPPSSGYNEIFVGSKGYLGTSGRGEGVGLLPGSRWAEYELPDPILARSPGASTGSNHAAHVRDWIRACKGGAPACSNFSIAGRYTEWLVLGAAALHFDGKLMWDNDRGMFSNGQEVDQWVKPTYRRGWEISL